MKLQPLSTSDTLTLISELRAMAALPPGPTPEVLKRAKEIRFQIQGQPGCPEHLAAKVDATYRALEILLSTKRWREHDVESLRQQVKSACSVVMKQLERE